jgi:hypothetical protein
MAAHRAANDTANNLRNYTTPRDSYRSRWLPGAIRAERSGAIELGSPLSWRLSAQTRLSSASEGGRQRLTGASLSERSEQCVRSERTRFRLRATTKSAAATARSARSGAEQSNTAQFAPRLVSVQDETLTRCGSSRERRQSRGAVLSQAGAPLSWTVERPDTAFVCERGRKVAAYGRQPQRAERAMCTERADMLSSASDDDAGRFKARCASSSRRA